MTTPRLPGSATVALGGGEAERRVVVERRRTPAGPWSTGSWPSVEQVGLERPPSARSRHGQNRGGRAWAEMMPSSASTAAPAGGWVGALGRGSIGDLARRAPLAGLAARPPAARGRGRHPARAARRRGVRRAARSRPARRCSGPAVVGVLRAAARRCSRRRPTPRRRCSRGRPGRSGCRSRPGTSCRRSREATGPCESVRRRGARGASRAVVRPPRQGPAPAQEDGGRGADPGQLLVAPSGAARRRPSQAARRRLPGRPGLRLDRSRWLRGEAEVLGGELRPARPCRIVV